ncbi:MAG TPA: hypothetical protein VNN08_12670 [Thermoanaerobaculia bacterium]|nr:hypothetical protein [Thermoanaerobaculia bacterium]
MAESTRFKSGARGLASLAVLLTFLTVVPSALAQSGYGGRRGGSGTGDTLLRLVPWRFLPQGGPLATGPLVLYWLPASPKEVEDSPLQTSKVLLQDADLCLGFEIVDSGDAVMIAKLGAAGKLPSALLVDAQGNVIRRVEGTRGKLNLVSVEKMVSDEFSARGETMYARMTEAKKRAAGGDKEGAIELYRKLWDERCFFPLAGEEAQHALKALGVIVVEPPPQIAIDPNLAPPKTKTAPSKHPDGH